MPLPNRVDPFGALHAVSARGLLMGNRGGHFHLPEQALGRRRWASRQWIACICEFRGRHRSVWATGYTELFFLDEVTALAAGHRPCFECRRSDALAFRSLFGPGNLRAAEIDLVLHRERLGEKLPAPRELPDGVMVAQGGQAFALRSGYWLRWSFAGYVPAREPLAPLLLTPPSIVDALARGYRPMWHPSAQPEPATAPAAPLPAAAGADRHNRR